MKPHTGWSQSTSDYASPSEILSHTGAFTNMNSGEPVGCIAWQDNSDNAWFAWTYDTGGFLVMEDDGSLHQVSAAGTYGTTSDWAHFGTFGQIPLMCANKNGTIWEWSVNTASTVTAVTNAPTDCVGMVVADERFILALKKRSVAWCDRDNRTVWTAATTNQAGSFSLDTEGELMCGLQMRGEVLILSSRDAFSARYIGYPNVWEFRKIGRCTLLGGNAACRVDDRAYWWGDEGFYVYQGGYVQQIPCEVWDYVSTDLSTFANALTSDRRRTFAWHNQKFSEVVWQYYSESGASTPDKYVAFNYANGTWSYGESPFGAVATRVPFEHNLGVPDVSTRLSHDYSSDPGYTLGTNWRIAGGVLDQSTPTASAASFTATGLPANWPIMFWVETTGRTAGTLTVGGSNMTNISVTTNDQYVAFGKTTASGTFVITFTSDGTYDGDVATTELFDYPVILVDDGSYAYPNITNAPYAETGPLDLGTGGQRTHVMQVIPDEQDAGELTLTFKTKEYPGGSETTHGPYQTSSPTDVRFSGRQFKIKVEHDTAQSSRADWRSGVHRLDVTLGGRR